jgi:hypothetical protein
MPTPFYHLSLAEELINHSDLPEPIHQFLQTRRCEFEFGNTAPDVQVISGQSRFVTHFFNLPIQIGDWPAWKQFLTEYPKLAIAKELPVSQAAFLAGYLCHLQADWLWVNDIFTPIFGPRCSWETFHQRLYYHNVLRAYLDLRILPELPADIDACLCQVYPRGWLPFVQDHYLMEWRDLLYPQLKPGAAIQTVEVFSSRQGISAPEYYALLASEERMQQEIFEHIPLGLIQGYRQGVLEKNIHLLSDYLVFTLHPLSNTIEENEYPGVQP